MSFEKNFTVTLKKNQEIILFVPLMFKIIHSSNLIYNIYNDPIGFLEKKSILNLKLNLEKIKKEDFLNIGENYNLYYKYKSYNLLLFYMEECLEKKEVYISFGILEINS